MNTPVYSVSEVAGGSILLRSSSVPLMVSTTVWYALETLSPSVFGRRLRSFRFLAGARDFFLVMELDAFFRLPTDDLRLFRAID